jgi:phosphoadenylyl-sulfate reductase (thioredoxin)
VRRQQTLNRANAGVVEPDQKFGLVKVNPLVAWTHKDIWNYVHKHKVPYNPLHDQGFPSIGCLTCTSKVQPGEDPRAGRWRGRAKTECGLHTAASPAAPEAPIAAPVVAPVTALPSSDVSPQRAISAPH